MIKKSRKFIVPKFQKMRKLQICTLGILEPEEVSKGITNGIRLSLLKCTLCILSAPLGLQKTASSISIWKREKTTETLCTFKHGNFMVFLKANSSLGFTFVEHELVNERIFVCVLFQVTLPHSKCWG